MTSNLNFNKFIERVKIIKKNFKVRNIKFNKNSIKTNKKILQKKYRFLTKVL